MPIVVERTARRSRARYGAANAISDDIGGSRCNQALWAALDGPGRSERQRASEREREPWVGVYKGTGCACQSIHQSCLSVCQSVYSPPPPLRCPGSFLGVASSYLGSTRRSCLLLLLVLLTLDTRRVNSRRPAPSARHTSGPMQIADVEASFSCRPRPARAVGSGPRLTPAMQLVRRFHLQTIPVPSKSDLPSEMRPGSPQPAARPPPLGGEPLVWYLARGNGRARQGKAPLPRSH
jgi:hypothetical protein